MVEIWINRYLYGSWDAFEGQIHPDFEPSIHVKNHFTVVPEWRRFIGIDHGRTNPTAVLWGAVDQDDILYIYREHYTGQDDYGASYPGTFKTKVGTKTYVIDPSTGIAKDDPETPVNSDS